MQWGLSTGVQSCLQMLVMAEMSHEMSHVCCYNKTRIAGSDAANRSPRGGMPLR